MDRFRTKQVAEAYYIEWDFTDLCGTATISSATVSAKIISTGADATATITTVGSQTVSSHSAFTWVKAGADGVDYQLTCVATASDGSIYELEGLMLVSNIPLAAVTTTGPGLVIAPVIEPVSLAELKAQLRIDSSDEDELLTSIIKSAREFTEDQLRRALLTQTFDYCIQGWPRRNYIKLPFGNLQSVTSIKWKDTDATETTLVVTTDYLVETNGDKCGRIVLPYGASWPSGTLYPSNPITIRFVCGWTTTALIPSKIKQAILMIAADLWSNRELQVFANSGQSYQINATVKSLLFNSILWEEL
jgi:uncharacterized phiE125 gp8 family phage protein